MPTLTGFTRTADPINADQLRDAIGIALSKSVVCDINISSINVSGNTLVIGDTALIQSTINSYVYIPLPGDRNYFIATNDMSNNPNMSADRSNKVITEHAAYSADSLLEGQIVGKADLLHSHSVAQVTGLQAFLDDKASISSLSSVAFTGSYADLSNKPTYSQTAVSRSLNTIFQPSTTRNVVGAYSVRIACSASLLGGQEGAVVFEISPSSTFASGIVEVGRIENRNSVALAIAITVNQDFTGTVVGTVPTNYYVRLRTINTTGTPTFTYKSGQETTIL